MNTKVNYDEYLKLSYNFVTGKKKQRRNYLAYANRELDFLMYVNMKEENPAKWQKLQLYLDSRHTMPIELAVKIREDGAWRNKPLGFPPYVPVNEYDRELSTLNPQNVKWNLGTRMGARLLRDYKGRFLKCS